MTPKRLQRALRFVTLALAAMGGAYLWNRYELIDLPGVGCSPLKRLRPGNTLWVDLSPGQIEVGDVLFFELPDGAIALAEVERLQLEPERYWVGGDDDLCPGSDSEELGWILQDQVHGRLIMALDL